MLVYSPEMNDPVGVPLPTLRRLPLYLRIFERCDDEGEDWLSSETVARELGFGAIQVRKDLGCVGALGSPKRGFPVRDTKALLSGFLGSDDCSETFLVGTGPLARAVLADEGIVKRGFTITAIFEPDPDARRSEDRRVQPLAKLPDLAKRMGTKLVIFAVEPRWIEPAAAAISRSEVGGVLDLSGQPVAFAPGMAVVRESFSAGLSSLAGTLRSKGPPKE